jgi:hypothetical protein
MATTPEELKTQDRVLELLAQRTPSYETAIQTTICWRTSAGWTNSLTNLDFVRTGEEPPCAVAFEYPEVAILRRLLNHEQCAYVIQRIGSENVLETGHSIGNIPLQVRFPTGGRVRWSHSEWSRWPSDIFVLEPVSGQPSVPDQSLVALDAPYYPSLDQVLSDFFQIRVQGWMNYFRGQVVVTLPDFRARISKLTVALAHMTVEIECPTGSFSDVVAKVYAEGQSGRLLQETIRLTDTNLQFDLSGQPSFASAALLWNKTGEMLCEKSFREGVPWREPGVSVEVVEVTEPDIEQLLLTGESETVEFKERLDKNRPERIAKTAAAFSNTKGGTIIFGVDDDHRIVGCEIEGLADRITNILRSHCDPPPTFRTKVVTKEGKDLLLVEIIESAEAVHTVKELGPFIRANGTNRSPTSHELALLYRRRNATEMKPPELQWRLWG